MVEQGVKPVVSPSFWLTMVRTRPVVGVHYHHAAALRAERRHGRPADGEIVAIDVIAGRGIHGRRPLRQRPSWPVCGWSSSPEWR